MARVRIEIDVDEEYADESHSSGLTEEGSEALIDAINSVGTVASGPDLVVR